VGKDAHLRAVRDLALARAGGDHVGEQARVAFGQNHLGFRRLEGRDRDRGAVALPQPLQSRDAEQRLRPDRPRAHKLETGLGARHEGFDPAPFRKGETVMAGFAEGQARDLAPTGWPQNGPSASEPAIHRRGDLEPVVAVAVVILDPRARYAHI
jgi:hypothetical protein